MSAADPLAQRSGGTVATLVRQLRARATALDASDPELAGILRDRVTVLEGRCSCDDAITITWDDSMFERPRPEIDCDAECGRT